MYESGAPEAALAAILRSASEAELSGAGAVALVANCERVIAWLHSVQVGALRTVVAHTTAWLAAGANPATGLIDPISAAGDEIASALGISPRAGTSRVAHAVELGGLPSTAAALQAGRLTLAQTRVVADELRGVDEASATEIEADVVGRVVEGTLAMSGLRRSIRRAVERVQPGLARVRCEEAVSKRGVWIHPLPNGMASFQATLKATHAISLYESLTRLGRWTLSAGDEAARSIDNLRADWLCYLVSPSPIDAEDVAAAGAPTRLRRSSGRGRRAAGEAHSFDDLILREDDTARLDSTPGACHVCRPVIRVTMDLSTLLGAADNVAELDGLGPIPSVVARELAGDGDWLRWILQPETGELLDAGALRYTPSAKLADFLRSRDPECRVPGCSRPARYCDIDHVESFNHQDPTAGGQTTRAGAGILCRRHHLLKTSGGWTLTQREDSTIVWTSPFGQSYLSPPFDHSGVTDRGRNGEPPDAEPPDAEPPDAEPPDAEPPDARPHDPRPHDPGSCGLDDTPGDQSVQQIGGEVV